MGQQFVAVNYLEDYLFIQMVRSHCNEMVSQFLKICEYISFPVSLEKTEWVALRLEFLGLLLDGEHKILAVSLEKKVKAFKMLLKFSDRKKATVNEIQCLAGFLNLLTKAIVPGRTFLRRMYSKYAGALLGKPIIVGNKKLCHYHHVRIDEKFHNDCKIWLCFLQEHKSVCRPFVNFSKSITAKKLSFATDMSQNAHLGFGCVFRSSWAYSRSEPGYIKRNRSSIEYLELYALVAGVLIWENRLSNGRYIVWCDNKSTCTMVNGGASSCKNYMYLLRVLTLNNLCFNRCIFASYISSRANFVADYLSRLKLKLFEKQAPRKMDPLPTRLPDAIWPASKIWIK